MLKLRWFNLSKKIYVLIINNEVRSFFLNKERKITHEEVNEGRQVNLSILGKGSFLKRESVERLISLLRAFHRKMSQI